MDVFDEEIVQLWNVLAKHNVRYIITGDFAVMFHGVKKRQEGTLHLWIDDTFQNREHLANAFTEMFEEDYSSFKTLEFVPGWTSFRFMSGFEIDIMTHVKGLEESFNECFDIAPVSDIAGVPVRFLHYNHLIRSKEAANRPRDQWDIEELKKRNPEA